MKGIYLTEEGKKTIEDRIVELQNRIQNEKDCENPIEYLLGEWQGKVIVYKQILSSTEYEPNIYTKEDMFESFSRYAFSSTSSQPYNEKELKEEFEKFIENLGNSKK
jgi:hypothetical protein